MTVPHRKAAGAQVRTNVSFLHMHFVTVRLTILLLSGFAWRKRFLTDTSNMTIAVAAVSC